jgi:hypothetical protein
MNLYRLPLFSGHNKPEAFWLFAQSDPSISKRRHIVYVEDCADHVLNFEQAFRRVFRSDDGGEHQSNTVDGNHLTTSTTSASSDNVQSTNGSVGGEANAVVDVFAQVDRAQFEFQDATLLFWPPACEDGFETFERHSADAHERLLKRCSETTE